MRVLALTGAPSLEVALGMIDDWEVVAVDTVARAAGHPDAAVLLIGQANSDDGIASARTAVELGLSMPIVIVGDEPRDDIPATLVLRPFSLEDLREAVDRALAAHGAPDEPADDAATASDEEAVDTDDEPQAGVVEVPEEPEPPKEPEPPEATEDLDGVDLAEVRTLPQKPPSPPAHPVERSTGSGALRLVKEPPVREPAAPPDRESAQEPAASLAQPAAPAEKVETAPARAEPPAPPPPTKPVPKPTPQPVAASRESRRSRRKRAKGPVPEPKDPLGGRLREAARAAHLIAEVLEQLPMLRDVHGLTQALIGEIADRFSPKTAAIYVRRGTSFVPVAGLALSPAEMKLAVPETHALVTEISSEGEAILIAPVDLARGIVTGIAGARTEALLAAPIAIDGVCSAFLVVGRDDFDDSDLDACELLAREAAAGLTIASALDALVSRPSGQ